MLKNVFCIAVASGLFITSTLHAKQPPLQLKPVSPWAVDYAEDHCRLARQFGAGDELTYIFLDRYQPGQTFNLTLAGKSLRTNTDEAEAAVTFGPSEQEQMLNFRMGTIGEMPALIFTGRTEIARPSDAELKSGKEVWDQFLRTRDERHKAVQHLEFGKPLRRTIILETGAMKAPLAALDKCMDNLLTYWGVNVDQHKSLTRWVTPQSDPRNWLNSDDYPSEMLRVGQPALVKFRLSVGADGVPTACHIQATTRPKEFDDAVCKSVMRRARLDPALDADGKPLASFYNNSVYFAIP
jgi:Gram-negative bacterial TonB protein C-terminal